MSGAQREALRALLPQDFRFFGIDFSENVNQFKERIAPVQMPLERKHVTSYDKFHSFSGIIIHSRPPIIPQNKHRVCGHGRG